MAKEYHPPGKAMQESQDRASSSEEFVRRLNLRVCSLRTSSCASVGQSLDVNVGEGLETVENSRVDKKAVSKEQVLEVCFSFERKRVCFDR